MTRQLVNLLSLPNMGRTGVSELLLTFEKEILTGNDLLDILEKEVTIFGIPRYSGSSIRKARENADKIIETSLEKGIRIISIFDGEYPGQLPEMKDHPLVLSYIGDIHSVLDKENVAVVGTRTPTPRGFRISRKVAGIFAENGFNVVSGLSPGCDTAAHRGALAKGGTTTAVVANGLDHVFPEENKRLAKKIVDGGGLLLSEYFPGENATIERLVERDRIQAGLCKCVFVAETDLKSRTMHTANFARQYRRFLACAPPPLTFSYHSPTEGNRLLITTNRAIPVNNDDELYQLIKEIRAL